MIRTSVDGGYAVESDRTITINEHAVNGSINADLYNPVYLQQATLAVPSLEGLRPGATPALAMWVTSTRPTQSRMSMLHLFT